MGQVCLILCKLAPADPFIATEVLSGANLLEAAASQHLACAVSLIVAVLQCQPTAVGQMVGCLINNAS